MTAPPADSSFPAVQEIPGEFLCKQPIVGWEFRRCLRGFHSPTCRYPGSFLKLGAKWIPNTAARVAGVWGFNGRRPRHLCPPPQAEAILEENDHVWMFRSKQQLVWGAAGLI